MKKIYIPFLLSLAVTACQEGNITPQAPAINDQMSFNVLVPGIQTKVTNDAFEATDVIGLYVTDYADETTPMPLQISGNRANNLSVTFDGAVWTPEQTIYWGEGKSDVYAYYPYIDNMSEIDNHLFSVATDQTVEYEASDFLWAKAEGVKRADGPVTLAMNHLMSKLTLRIMAGEDYVGSLPDDAVVLLHNTVTDARLDLTNGAVVKDPYSGEQSIKMRNLGIRSYEDGEAVVYEAIVVPQMIEASVPLFEINSKSVSYLIEDYFNFRPGTAYVYTATLNASTTSIKVEIDCELEDWNSTGGSSDGSGDGGDTGEGGDDDDDTTAYTDLSAEGSANCYIVSEAGDYKFKSVIGNSDATAGNIKSVEVLWESFGTDVAPNVGDLVASVSYKDGYIRFSTPAEYAEGNAVIAAKNSSGVILWSWHIWLTDRPEDQVYANDAGTMMDRNLGATSATPGEVGALGLLYQWGRKDPFLGSSDIYNSVEALSTITWPSPASDGTLSLTEENPTTFYKPYYALNGSWDSVKTIFDPCPQGYRVPDGGENGVWAKAGFATASYETGNGGLLFQNNGQPVWYPASGFRYSGDGSFFYVGSDGRYWSCSPGESPFAYVLSFDSGGNVSSAFCPERAYGYSVRCLQE